MDDRELLERAAKAYGDQNVRIDHAGGRRWIGRNEDLGCDVMVTWNPLTDDGDALRMAVKLRLNIQHYVRSTGVICVQAVIDWGMGNDAFHEEHGDSPSAATRRAIVRAAAEIGKSMQEAENV